MMARGFTMLLLASLCACRSDDRRAKESRDDTDADAVAVAAASANRRAARARRGAAEAERTRPRRPVEAPPPHHCRPRPSRTAQRGIDLGLAPWTRRVIHAAPPAHSAEINAVQFSPDGTRVLSGDRWGRVVIWDVVTGEAPHVVDGPSGLITALAMSPDGKILAGSVTGGERDALWWARMGERGWRDLSRPSDSDPDAADDRVQAMAFTFSPDGRRVVCQRHDEVKVYSVGGAARPVTLAVDGSGAGEVIFAQGRVVLRFADHEDHFDAITGRRLRRVRLKPAAKHSRIEVPNDAVVLRERPGGPVTKTLPLGYGATRWDVHPATGRVVATDGSRMTLVETKTGRRQSLSARPLGVRAVAFDPAGGRLVTGWSDGTVRSHGLAPLGAKEVGALGAPVVAVAFSEDGARYVAATAGKAVVYDAASGAVSMTYTAPKGKPIADAALCADGGTLAVVGTGLGITRCDVATGQCPAAWRYGDGDYRSIEAGGDGTWFGAAGELSGVQLWAPPEIAALQIEIHAPIPHFAPSVAGLFPTRRRVAVSGPMGPGPVLWEEGDPAKECVLPFVDGYVAAMTIRKDGSLMATGGTQFGVSLRQLPSARYLRTLRTDGAGIRALAFGPDGAYLAVVDLHGTLELWRMGPLPRVPRSFRVECMNRLPQHLPPGPRPRPGRPPRPSAGPSASPSMRAMTGTPSR